MGLRVHGQTNREWQMSHCLRVANALTAFCLLMSSGVCRAEAAEQIRNYELGPYPVQQELEGINETFWVWLRFTPVIVGRIDPTYQLKLTVFVQVNHLPTFVSNYATRKLPTDNCARFNVDNWVYHVVPEPLAIYKDHTLRLTAKGDISTWTCLPGLQELVCHDLECKMRDGDPIKSRNLQQGFEATKDWYLDVTHDGKLTYGDPEPLIYFTGDSIGSEILGILALVTHNLGSGLRHSMVVVEDKIPPDYKFLNPKYEWAGFIISNHVEWMTAEASVSITTAQIEEFMKKYFPGTWQGLMPQPTSPPKQKMTKQLMREECDKYAPGVDILDCASSMGWNYPALPDQ